jgi:hypothetical protein
MLTTVGTGFGSVGEPAVGVGRGGDEAPGDAVGAGLAAPGLQTAQRRRKAPAPPPGPAVQPRSRRTGSCRQVQGRWPTRCDERLL